MRFLCFVFDLEKYAGDARKIERARTRNCCSTTTEQQQTTNERKTSRKTLSTFLSHKDVVSTGDVYFSLAAFFFVDFTAVVANGHLFVCAWTRVLSPNLVCESLFATWTCFLPPHFHCNTISFVFVATENIRFQSHSNNTIDDFSVVEWNNRCTKN